MEPIARDAFTPAIKQKILEAIKIDPGELIDLGGFESFVFELPVNQSILRITHISHRNMGQILGELEFVNYLARAGASVCRSIAFEDGCAAKQFDEFIVCQFRKANGAVTDESDWEPGLFKKWGTCIGEFHRAAKTFVNPNHPRIDWRADENLNFRARIPDDQTRVVQQADACLTELARLETNEDSYGIIHGDAHAGNFFLDNGKLTFFDFDDCGYQWFAFDVATIVFGAVLQPWMGDGQSERDDRAKTFLQYFYEGYDRIVPVNSFMLHNMPLFLKTRELSQYAVIHAHMDVTDLRDWFPVKFMHDRKERLEDGEPFVSINL